MSDESTVSPFDTIRHEDEVGEYWSARELAVLLEYTRWQQFPAIITKAKIACETSGHAVSDHFQDVLHMVAIGSGARRKLADTKLSRYACYLVVQNADPEQPVVALGQTYFAVQTREMELTQELISQMDEDQQRLFYREESGGIGAQEPTAGGDRHWGGRDQTQGFRHVSGPRLPWALQR